MGLFTTDNKKTKKRVLKYRDLLKQEAIIGGKVFGPIPEGVRREFFMLDTRTWVWHEEWTDQKNHKHSQTTRYEVRPDGIVKYQDNQPNVRINAAEANNLAQAAERYEIIISNELYGNKSRQDYLTTV